MRGHTFAKGRERSASGTAPDANNKNALELLLKDGSSAVPPWLGRRRPHSAAAAGPTAALEWKGRRMVRRGRVPMTGDSTGQPYWPKAIGDRR